MSQTNGVISDNSIENGNEIAATESKNNSFDLLSVSLVTAIPQYGVKMKFNHKYPEKRTQNIRPSMRQSLPLIPLAWRYVC